MKDVLNMEQVNKLTEMERNKDNKNEININTNIKDKKDNEEFYDNIDEEKKIDKNKINKKEE